MADQQARHRDEDGLVRGDDSLLVHGDAAVLRLRHLRRTPRSGGSGGGGGGGDVGGGSLQRRPCSGHVVVAAVPRVAAGGQQGVAVAAGGRGAAGRSGRAPRLQLPRPAVCVANVPLQELQTRGREVGAGR